MMKLKFRVLAGSILTGVLASSVTAMQGADVSSVEANVNAPVLQVTAQNRSYRALFDAFLDLEPAPTASGRADGSFNLNTIHPGMSNWTEVSDWAESNPHMRDAMLACRDKLLIGLPYGREALQRDLGDATRFADYVDNGLYADIAVNGDLRQQNFAYMSAMDTINAFAVAETYRLLEAGDDQLATDLVTAALYVNDQLCERQFLIEKSHAIQLQIDLLAALRDQMYLYEDVFTVEQLSASDYEVDDANRKGFASEMPWLRIDLMDIPRGDYVAADELLNSVFAGDEPDPVRFVEVFSQMQSEDAPLTQFGAAKRWRMVSAFHASKLASKERLQLVFDDWWRRWDVRAWHDILDLEPQYDRTNPIRFAAVTYMMRDMGAIFDKRRELVAAANATALAAGLVGYKKQYGQYPDDLEKIYATFVRKRIDTDPFDKEGGSFGYRWERSPVYIDAGALGFVQVSGAILWSRGLDFESQRGEKHSDSGSLAASDIVYWPPLRAVSRSEGG